MTESITAWQCVGCGKIAADAPCVGVCEDHPVRLMYASEFERLQTRFDALSRDAIALGAVVRQLAWATPCAGQWERGYLALQLKARLALAALEAAPGRPRDGTPVRGAVAVRVPARLEH